MPLPLRARLFLIAAALAAPACESRDDARLRPVVGPTADAGPFRGADATADASATADAGSPPDDLAPLDAGPGTRADAPPAVPGRWVQTYVARRGVRLTAVAADAVGRRFVVAGTQGTALVGGAGEWSSVDLQPLLAPYAPPRGDLTLAWADAGRLFVGGALGFYAGGVVELGGPAPLLSLGDPPPNTGRAPVFGGGPVLALLGRAGELWAHAGEHVHRFDGIGWSRASRPLPERNAWMAPDGTTWAAGRDLHRGSVEGWTPQDWQCPGWRCHLAGIWGSEDRAVFAVGQILPERFDQPYLPVAVVFDGATWRTFAGADLPEGSRRLHAVWGTGRNDVYAVGDDGTVLHFDGARWRLEALDEAGHLYGVAGLGDQLVVVGQRGVHERRRP